MDGFTVGNSNRLSNAGVGGLDSQSLSINKPKALGDDANVGGTSFADTLKQAIGQVNDLQKSSDKATQNLATGRTDDVAGVMIAAEKADIALRVMVNVRNKIIDAYNEIMKMQV